ncbi:MAG: glycosyltransferase, partial [Muribaculaceae bacterium]|nr:glycosyltransferase [Muribaculaceae bacterium]
MESVSVIIPAFNSVDTLGDCLDSVLSQSGDFGMEVIVVDDGSTDATPELLARYRGVHPGTISVLRQPHCGQSTARNSALDIASGRWIVFVDADDRLLPDAIATLLRAAITFRAPIACGAYVRREKSASAPLPPVNSVIDSRAATETLLYQTDQRLSSSLWGKIFSRHLFDGLRLWDGHIYEDLDIMPRLFLRASAVALTSAAVYHYRRNPRSTLSVWSDRRKDMLDVVGRVCCIPEIAADPALLRAAHDRTFCAACNCLLNMFRHADRDPATLRRCLALLRATASA